MYRYTTLMISFLLAILFYAIPAYSGPPVPLGCCEQDSPKVVCSEAVSEDLCEGEGGNWIEGENYICDNNEQCNLPVLPDHLICYQVKDPLQLPKEKDSKTIFVSVPQFGSEVRCELKGRAREFCAPACKAKQGDPPVGAGLCQPDADNPKGFDRVCYNIENCGEISGLIDRLEVYVTDQFDDTSVSTEGPRLFKNFNPHQICTPAFKCTGGCEDLYPGESCGRSGEVCDVNCQCGPPCGNGQLDSGEECDTGASGPSSACEIGEICSIEDNCTCQPETYDCGNGILEPGEVCDDNNNIDGDDCSANCLSDETCGNNIVDCVIGEQCEEGAIDTTTCDGDCTLPYCGDGYLNTVLEQCDDVVDSLACDSDCTIAECGDGYLNTTAGEQCEYNEQCLSALGDISIEVLPTCESCICVGI